MFLAAIPYLRAHYLFDRQPQPVLTKLLPGEVRTVQLHRTTGSFGFTVVEQIDLMGMRIGSVTPGGVADQSHAVFPGDVLLKVKSYFLFV